ncbi:isopeptide-forming domain-containing fimbrial protein [Limnoglobus roseus]|uniref:Uncharacterized protein n=1 Tax=Limnoglobus roseus TaxID=2598579 RepID=A0A5C1A4E6_9BACT|nr:isopeptide-forming domain-containing fimbrial protein [Limnoglobus roseus]QEL13971.1 hypothetical protein PX52LOC_00831 [Limnoglobus roseus]
MNFTSLLLLAPLAAGVHPGKQDAGCATGNCPPMTAPKPNYLMPYTPVPPQLIAQACPPMPPAPLLATKIVVPTGVRIVAAPGTGGAKIFTASTTFGLRPGYVYRFELTGLTNRPNESLYPEIEVRGSLAPRPGMNYMDYPAAINFSEIDLAKAALGSLITKVIYLEDPEKAVPVKTTADRPLEQFADTEDDAIHAAAENGRPVLIVRLGNRVPTEADLNRAAIPGTVLLPGEQALGRPAASPTLGWYGVPLYDPILGPKQLTEECFTDGGDTKNPLGIRGTGDLGGLDATDVALEYSQGDKRKVTTSNKVCVCVPRFAVQKVEVNAGGLYFAYRLEAGVQRTAASSSRSNLLVQAVSERLKPVGLEMPIRPMAQIGRQGAELVIGTQKATAHYTVNGTQVVKSSVEPDELVNFPNEMIVTKSVEPKANVKIGDEVTFTLTYKNDTSLPVSDLVLSDSLSPRLEYAAGSGRSDRPTNVTTELNGNSTVVKFEIPGTLQPGQGGVVKFKAKVR